MAFPSGQVAWHHELLSEASPTETAPTEPLPPEPLPTEPLPTESLPTEPLPTESLPTEPLPTEPLPTFGVEEEFLLLDRVSGLPMWVADAVLERAEPSRSRRPESSLTREVLRCQVESATPICRSAAELEAHLRSARCRLAEAADAQGAVLSPVGAAPIGEPHASITASDRYLAMHDTVPALLNEQLLDGMHVHVAVPSRAVGVDVVNRLRPRLHILLALSANSPFWRGRDSGFASWRSVHAQRWPVEGPPPFFAGLEDYERRVETLLASGVIMDRAMLYWHARVSDRYPTVEIRVTDVALDATTAACCASLARALVAQAQNEGSLALPVPCPTPDAVRAAAWQAAHHGLGDGLLELTPSGGGQPRLRPASALVLDVAEAACVALPPAEREATLGGVHKVLDSGGGAQRQRAAVREGGMHGLLQLLRSSVTG